MHSLNIHPKYNLNILILESIASDAELVNKYLEHSNIAFKATIAPDHSVLLKALIENDFDIILADYSLFSLEAVRMAREKDKNIPFILVSGVAEAVAINIVRNQGADDYILITHLNRLPTAIRQAMKFREMTRKKEACEISLEEKNSSDKIEVVPIVIPPHGRGL